MDLIAKFIARDNTPESIGEQNARWKMYTDGASNERCFGAGVILVTPKEYATYYVLRLYFPATNNEADYKALIAGLKTAKELGVKTLFAIPNR